MDENEPTPKNIIMKFNRTGDKSKHGLNFVI